LETAIFYMVLG